MHLIQLFLELSANAGTKGDGGIIRMHATNGSIMLASNAGSNFYARGGTESGAGGDVIFTATQDITAINTQIDSSAPKLGDGSAALGVDIKTVNLLTFAGSIHADGKGSGTGESGLPIGNGGLVAIECGLVNLADPTFSATSESATGGKISIRVNASDFAANTFSSDVSASGSGTSGTLEFKVPNGNLLVSGSINADGHGSASGGTIIIDANNLVFLNPTTLSAAALGSDGSGGQIKLNLRQTDLVLGSAAFPLSFAVQGGFSSGDGGSVEIRNAGNLSLQENALGNATPNVRPEATISDVSLLASPTANNGTLTIGSNITISNTTTGGSIKLGAATVNISSGSVLKANGRSGGGKISITDGAGSGLPQTITLGQDVSLLANASKQLGGTGGTITLNSSGNITMESATLDVSGMPGLADKVGTRGNISIHAGATLTVSSSLTAIAEGDAGLTGISMKGAQLVFGAATLKLNVNGSSSQVGPGLLFSNAGVITIQSEQGDVTLGGASVITANGGTQGGDGGNITILAKTNVSLGIALQAKAIANGLGNGGSGGKVRITADGNISINGINVSGFKTDQGSNPGNGGTVELSYAGTNPLTLDGKISTGFFSGTVSIIDRNTSNDLVLNASTTGLSAQSVNFISARKIDVSMAKIEGVISAGSSYENGVVSGSPLSIHIRSLDSKSRLVLAPLTSTGDIQIQTPSDGSISASSITAQNGSVIFTTSEFRASGNVQGSTVTIQNPGSDITVTGGNYVATATSSPLIKINSNNTTLDGVLTFKASSGGMQLDITGVTQTNLLSNSSVTAGGNISLSTPLLTNNGSIHAVGGSLNCISDNSNLIISGSGTTKADRDLTITGGVINISISLSGGNIFITSQSVHSKDSPTISTTGILQLVGSVIDGDARYDGGSISVFQNGATPLSVAGTFKANNGNLTIQNTSGGLVYINGGLFEATGGTGRIYIVSGSIPQNSSLQEATAFPNLVFVTKIGTGKVYFANGTSPLSPDSAAFLNVDGSGIIFSGAPSSIRLAFTIPAIVMFAKGPTIVTSASSLPPGINGGTPPGQGGAPFGLIGVLPPGLGGQNPAFGGLPPGQLATNPSKSGNTPVSKFRTAQVDDTQDRDKTPGNQEIAISDTDIFKPVCFIQPATCLTGAQTRAYSVESDSATCKFIEFIEGTVLVYKNANNAVLKKGEALVFARRQFLLDCGKRKVKICAGSIVLVNKSEQSFSVSVLHDQRRDSITIGSESGTDVHVCIGQQVVFGRKSELLKLTRADGIARRNIAVQSLLQEEAVANAEFSFVSLAVHSDIVYWLMHESNKQSKSALKTVLKDFACLSMIRNKQGSYSSRL